MRILFLDQFSEVAGAQRCLLDLLSVRGRNWEAHAGVPGTGPLRDQLAERGVAVHGIRCGRYGLGHKSTGDVVRFGAGLPRLVHDISALIAETQPDVLYVNGPRLLPAVAVAARNGPGVVFHSHNYLSHGYSAALAGLALRATKAEVIACCRFVARRLAPYVNPDRLHVVYNGVETSAADQGRPPGPVRRVGMIGRTGLDKGQEVFIEAAGILARGHSGCEFVICGVPLLIESAYVERLRTLASGLPFTFLGWQRDPAQVFSQIDVLVVPSSWTEATPRVIMEAFAAGVPVVAFRRGGIPEIATHGETAYLIDTFTPEALASGIAILMKSPDLTAKLVRNAAAACRDRYSVERYRQDVLRIIEQVSNRTGREALRTANPM